MLSNRSHFSLVRNVVNSQKRSRYNFCYLLINKKNINCIMQDQKLDYNLKLKLFLINRMHSLFQSNFQLRSYFTKILNYPKKPSVPLISLESRRISTKELSPVQHSNENEKSQLSNVDMDFISDYLYEKAMIDFSVKMLKENFKSSSQWLVKLIKCEGELNKTAVENVLKNFKFLRKKMLWDDERERGEVGKSKEIQDFLKALQLHLSEISPSNLISAISFIITLGIKTDHDVALLIILRLIDELDELVFRERVFLYNMLRLFNETDLVKELRLELKQEIEKQITGNLHSFSSAEIVEALKFVSTDTVKWNDNDLLSLCNAALKTDESIWSHRYGFTACFKIIHKLKDPDINIYREKLFKKLYEYMLQSHDNNGSINLCEFAVTYALNVHLQKEPYIAEFFDHIIDSIFKNRITLNDWQTLLFSMEILGHVRFDVIERMRNIFVERPLLTYHSFYLFKNVILLIIDSNCAAGWRKPWPHFELFLENLISLKDMSFWYEEDINLCLRVAAALASVGIFSDNILEFLSQKLNELEADQRICIPFLYIAINQAVAVLHPSYPKTFLTEEVLSSLQSRMPYSSIPEYLHSFNSSVKEIFESVLPNENYFLVNQKTKLGHNIQIVTAVNREREFFNFSSFKKKDQICIEDIILPPDHKLILVLTFSESHYTRNMFSLKSVARIRVKTLEKMGYEVLYILYGKWVNLTYNQQRSFIKSKLNRLRFRFSRSSLDKT